MASTERLLGTSNNPLVVVTTPSGAAGGDLAGTYPNPTIGAGKVTGPKIATTALRIAKNVTGHNGAGACTATGLKIGDVVLVVSFAKVPSAVATTQAGLTAFESTITVADQIQQTGAADLHLEAFDVLVLAQS